MLVVRDQAKIVLLPVPALCATDKKAWLRSQLDNVADEVFGHVFRFYYDRFTLWLK